MFLHHLEGHVGLCCVYKVFNLLLTISKTFKQSPTEFDLLLFINTFQPIDFL